ncbi:hypothetical protein D7T48_20480 [Stenotrophomonas maltophilia]|nr:hypothetical protein [Stenotrophomonas maltophilia]MBA0414460.1 hypothetical protein [Stenotrophomonas maltophilia]MBA0499949.1 hypothetical protein [Stenotrophomonas maltophilia]MBA0504434.1 hypothetical protein [Stenotrophomonas maltophilia]MBA0507356.1 hypothetical protein [Stenotrophomonas maltophilia]
MTGIGTGAGTGARWGSRGPAVGGLSGPVFLGCREGSIHAWRGSTAGIARPGRWPSMPTRCACPAPVDPRHAWMVSRPRSKTNGPASRGRLPSEVPTSDRAGTGGIQMFLSDIDVELFAAARVVFVTL